MTYRISLRSSSLWEPRHPLLKVLVSFFISQYISLRSKLNLGTIHCSYYKLKSNCFQSSYSLSRRMELKMLVGVWASEDTISLGAIQNIICEDSTKFCHFAVHKRDFRF